MEENKAALRGVIDQMEHLPLEAKVEVLANVFLRLGMENIETSKYEGIENNDIFGIVLDDIKKNGETISNSLARQGLLLLTWIDKEKI